MKGQIKSLGKNNAKNYFFIRGEDGKLYFAPLSEVNTHGAVPSTMLPNIYPGAQVLSFDVEKPDFPKDEKGRKNLDRAVNIELDLHVSGNTRYWEGRSDALREFQYWYENGGKDSGSKNVLKYLDRMSGNTDKTQVAQMGLWHSMKVNPPKDNKNVLLQVYSMSDNLVLFTIGHRSAGNWITQSGAILEDEHQEFIPQAWMELPDPFVNHPKE